MRRTALLMTLAVAFATTLAPRLTSADAFSALGGDKMSVQADKLEVDVAGGFALLTGKVLLNRGDLKVSCPKIELKFDSAPHITWMKGTGGVSADVRGVHGEAPEVEVDLSRQTLELRGGVRLARGNGWLQADKATIELGTGKVTLTQVKGSVPVPK